MHMLNQNVWRTILTAGLLIPALPESVSAIPAFARKYTTSCATCHVGYPKLTPFGEAFRLHGFQMPADDESATKEEPVKLGSEGYKRVWPKAIWPGSIPGTAPVSFRIRTTVSYHDDAEGRYVEFTQPALQIMTGGGFGEGISFYAGAHLFEHGSTGSVDRLYLRLNHLLARRLPYNLLNLRIGQFVPDLTTYITNHRGLTHTAFAYNTFGPENTAFEAGHVHDGSTFGLETFQLGAEISGMLTPRLRYAAGILNGNGMMEDNNGAKDYFGKLALKLGGLTFDGVAKGDIYGGRSDNWAEQSLTVSLFGYRGIASPVAGDDGHDGHAILSRAGTASGDHAGEESETPVTRVGIDLNLFLRDLNLFGGWITGKDDEARYTLWFSEADYMVYPWLIGVLRYENATPDAGGNLQRLVVHTTALYTANLKFNLETRLDPGATDFDNLVLGIDFAF